jgi:protoheme IX farnesyltransferase
MTEPITTTANSADAGYLAGADWGDGDIADFVALLKPRVMSLVVFTAIVGMAASPGGLHPVLALISLVSIAVGAGASGALNMWYDADADCVMRRTSGRPIPAGRLRRSDALGFGIVLAAFAVATLGLASNWLAAALLAFTIFFYVVVYTMWLKRWTAQNIVIGGAAGALPPVIGWAAMTGSVSLEPLLYFLIIFMWTPPHFWALALFASGDYQRAGIPMLPNVAGAEATTRQILYYSVALAPLGLLPWGLGFASYLYGFAALVLGAELVRRAVLLWLRGDADRNRAAKSLFGYSIVYLFALFAARLAEVVLAGTLGG